MQEDYDLGNGSLVMLDSKNGDILALIGSYDYENAAYGKFDVATLGKRQPGSALKPILFALAFEKKYTPATVLMDVETEFGVPEPGQEPYKPKNYDGKYRGPVQLRFALANSLNVPAVKVLALGGVRDFLQLSYNMGLSTLAPTEANMKRFGLSIALGGGEVTLLELTSAYTVFANGGKKVETQFIEEIRDYNNKVIYKKPKVKEKKVLSEGAAFLVSHILSDDIARADAFGRGSLLNVPGKTVAVKTGTTDEKRDNWAVGFTKDITIGVWVGNNDNTKLNEKVASGTTGATSIWNKAMKAMLAGEYDDGIMDKPENVEAKQIDSFFGGLPKDGVPERSEYFIKGTEPDAVSPFYKKVRIIDGKLANEVQEKSGQGEEKEMFVITEADPVSPDGKNRWQEGIDQWIEKQTDDKYKIPKETQASGDDLVVVISDPKNRSTVDSNDVKVKAKMVSGPDIKKVELFVNGEKKKSWDGNTREIEETIHLDDGVYKVQVVAENQKDKRSESTMEIGVKRPWDKP